MFRKMNAFKPYKLGYSLLPIFFSIICVFTHSFGLIAFLPIILLGSIALNPYSRKFENIWMFVLVVIAGLPINVMLIKCLSELLFDDMPIFPLIIFRNAVLYFMLLSLEELLLGIITRLIWKEQMEISILKQLYNSRTKLKELTQFRRDS